MWQQLAIYGKTATYTSDYNMNLNVKFKSISDFVIIYKNTWQLQTWFVTMVIITITPVTIKMAEKSMVRKKYNSDQNNYVNSKNW